MANNNIYGPKGPAVGYITETGDRIALMRSGAGTSTVGYFDKRQGVTYQVVNGSSRKLGNGNMMQVLIGMLIAENS